VVTKPESNRRRAATLGFKLAAIFSLLTVLVVVGVAVVVRNLVAVRIDARRMLEENREMRLAYGLVTELERVESLLAQGSDAETRALARETLVAAREALSSLGGGEGHQDPSDPGHQQYETGLASRLVAGLDELETRLRGHAGPADPPAPAGLVRNSRALAEDLSREMRIEAMEATRDLERRVRGMLRVIWGSVALSLAALLLGFWLVHRSLVRPVRALREGTRRFGEGRLDHRVRPRSRDEIGELALEFNRMAERLEASYRDLESQVEERTRQLLHAARLASVGTFAAGVAHEVNTPLATIAWAAEGLERRLAGGELDRETAVEYAETIRREAFRSSEIIARMLAFARLDPGPFERCDLAPRMTDLARVLARRFRDRGLRLELQVDGGIPAVRVNGGEIDQAVINLLTNAADASPRGQTVWLRCQRHREGLAIEVEDRGHGIAPENRGQIFDPFFTTKQPGEGTGLGLSLTYRIAERHGGRIEVEQPAVGGTLFRMVLPAERAGEVA